MRNIQNFIKGALVAAAMLIGTSAYAQIQDEKNVTITMELVPILQLNMNTPDQVNFVFDEISEYLGGITKYGATILTASSTVSWDLFASGTSGAHQAAVADVIWDAQVAYGNTGGSAIDALPLRALELRQFPSDINNGLPATDGDYGAIFTPNPSPQVRTAGVNNVYVSATTSPYTAPASIAALGEDRYIAGGDGALSFVAGGSYLTETSVAAIGADNAYYFVIDYRIVPGLPAIFPFASDGTGAVISAGPGFIDEAAGQYAQPGVYTMNVKYLMIENQ
jgi:hypothetical protein